MAKPPPFAPKPADLTAAWQHVLYEISMLHFCRRALVDNQPPLDGRQMQDAVLESFAVHARVLFDFLFDRKRFDTDVTAGMLVPDVAVWIQARGEPDAALAVVKPQADKHVAHLTFERTTLPEEKAWDVGAIHGALARPIIALLQYEPPRGPAGGLQFPARPQLPTNLVATGINEATFRLVDDLKTTR